MAGQEAIRANRAGLPVYASFLDDELARRAWLHTIGRELVRLSRHAREALKTLKSLRGDS
jgi:hypothetical protein